MSPFTSASSLPTAAARVLALTLLLAAAQVFAHPHFVSALASPATELSAARAVFEANLDAIRRRDRDAYLACYLPSDSLARTGPAGFQLGYADLARNTGQGWPDFIEGSDLRLVWVKKGVVYGTYRYRVRFGATEQTGLSERFFLDTEDGWKIAVTSAFPAPPGTPPPPRAIVGGTLIDGTGRPPLKDAVVLLRDGKVECAGPRSACAIPAGVDTLDARGLWITPGLIDAHVHHSQTGWADGRPDALDVRAKHPYEETQRRLREHPEALHRSYLASGVTAVFDVGGYPWTVALQRSAEDDTRAPRVAAAGPLLSTLDHWLNLPAERQFIYLKDEASAREGVRYLKSLGVAAVKVWFIVAPGRDFDEMERCVAAAGEAARAASLPLIVHATGLKEAKAALRAGARLLVHSVFDQPVDAEFLDLAKQSGAIYCPTLTVAEGYGHMTESVASGRPPKIDDQNGAVDSLTVAHVLSTPEFGTGAKPATGPAAARARAAAAKQRAELTRTLAANLLAVHRAGIPVAMGTDAGNPLTLHGPSVHAEMEAMRKAGLSAMDVLVAATRGGAAAMGRADLGTVEAGKAADLLLVSGDPSRDVANLRRIAYVVRGGEVRPLAELRVRAASGAKAAAGR